MDYNDPNPTQGAQRERRPPIAVADAAVYLGTTERHVRRMLVTRQIPFIKMVGKVRFLPDELDEWLMAQRVDATNAPSA